MGCPANWRSNRSSSQILKKPNRPKHLRAIRSPSLIYIFTESEWLEQGLCAAGTEKSIFVNSFHTRKTSTHSTCTERTNLQICLCRKSLVVGEVNVRRCFYVYDVDACVLIKH